MYRYLIRQLGKPGLLAATYKGDAAGIAAAAMEEVESTLVSCLHELERLSFISGGNLSWAVKASCILGVARCQTQFQILGKDLLWSSEGQVWPSDFSYQNLIERRNSFCKWYISRSVSKNLVFKESGCMLGLWNAELCLRLRKHLKNS